MTPSRTLIKIVATCLFLITTAASLTVAHAEPFCRDVLDSFDFERGVFAGPDPDIMPNYIHQYIRTRVEHQVNKGQLSSKDAEYMIDFTTNELGLFQDIAQICRGEPESGIRLIDRLLEPHFKSGRLTEHQAETGNQTAHETLDAIWKACQVFWMEQDTPAACILADLKDENGQPLFLPEGLEVRIEEGSLTGFQASAWHRNGDRKYVMNAQGDIFENVVEPVNDR